MHEVYIAMELTIYIFNFSPSINKVVYYASKKKRVASVGIRTHQSGCKPFLEPIVQSHSVSLSL